MCHDMPTNRLFKCADPCVELIEDGIFGVAVRNRSPPKKDPRHRNVDLLRKPKHFVEVLAHVGEWIAGPKHTEKLSKHDYPQRITSANAR